MLNKIRQHSTLIDQMIFSGGNFVFAIAAAKLLGAEQFGYYSGIVLVQYFLLALSQSFVGQPFQVIYKKDEAIAHRVFLSKWNISINAVLVIVAWGVGSMLSFLHTISWLDMALAAVGALGLLMNDFYRKRFIVTNPFGAVIQDGIIMSIQIIGILALFVLQIPNVHSVILLYAISFLPVFILALKERFTIGLLDVDTRAVSRHYRKEWRWLFPTSVIQWLAGNFLVAASGALLGAGALAAMRLTQTLFGVINIGLQVIENSSIPQAVVHFREGQHSLQNYLRKLTARLLTIGLPVLVVVFLISGPAVEYFLGEDYRAMGPLMKGMSVLYILILFGYPVRIGIRAVSMGKNFLIAYVATALLSIALISPLIQWYGAMGVVVGLALNQIVMQVYWMTMLKRSGVSLIG